MDEDKQAQEQGSSAEESAGAELRGPWWYSERRSVTHEQRQDVLRQLFYEGPDLVPFLTRFAALLSMAILIALFGLARDSAPVVIGAMLISPLTTPILGLATALVLGDARRQLSSAGILVAASIGGVGLAIAVTYVLPDAQQTTLSSQELLDRTTPGILDLAVAVVAGAAGAYILVRREAVSALPGVAIAVALVPPLTTIGMTLELGAGELAVNALLLYVTNLAGIVLSAAVVMLLMGVGHRPSAAPLPRRIKLGLTTAVLAAVLVAVPLIEHTRRTLHDSVDRDDSEKLALRWLDGTNLTLGEVTIEGTDEIQIDVFGPKPPPPVKPLAEEIAKELEEPVTVTVRYTPVATTVLEVEPPGGG